MGNFKPNKAGLKKLEQQLATELQVPKGGSEADAVASVKKQMKDRGITPNEAAVRKMVKDVRGN